MALDTADVGRNDPCPCGSGDKFKHCHLGKETELREGGGSDPVDNRLAIAIAVAGGILGVVLGSTQGVDVGVAIGGGIVLAVGAWVVFRNPPPPKSGGSDPAAINFGGS